MVNHDVIRSMSRPGTPYDNAVMDRWWNDFQPRWIDKHLKNFKKLFRRVSIILTTHIDQKKIMTSLRTNIGMRSLFLALQHKLNFYYFMCQFDRDHCR